MVDNRANFGANAPQPLPEPVVRAAAQYVQHLESLARHRALVARALESGPDAREGEVLDERDHREWEDTAKAGAAFRGCLRAYVMQLRREGEPIGRVMEQVGNLARTLPAMGAILEDGGQLEAAVIRWAVEDYYTGA
jgi:hypothetical protein